MRWTARFRLDGTRIAQCQLPAVLPLLPLVLPDRRRVLARLDWIHGDFETFHEVEDIGQLCVTQGMLVGLGGGRDGRPSQLVHIGTVLHARTGEALARRVADLPLPSRVASNEAIFWSDDELIHRVA